ncbi:Urea transporter [Trinorchestia longiramus]|nr:Urea transporter [Trinorchestia longiramus]
MTVFVLSGRLPRSHETSSLSEADSSIQQRNANTPSALGAPDALVCDGVTAFNSLLVGAVCTAVVPPLLEFQVRWYHYLLIAAASIITCYVDVGLNSLMSPTRLPTQSIPFNIVAAGLVLAARGAMHGYGSHLLVPFPEEEPDDILDYDFSTYAKELKDNFTAQQDVIQWSKVFEGSIVAAGQVYGVGNLTSSVIIWLAFFIYSPILTAAFYTGSTIASFIAALLNPGPLVEVYEGLWSFNSLLVSGGLFFFLQPSFHTVIVVIVGAVMAVLLQATILHIFVTTQVPVFSFPFTVVITVLLAISTQTGTSLTFVTNRSSPEQHLYERIKGIYQDEEADANAPERRPFQA